MVQVIKSRNTHHLKEAGGGHQHWRLLLSMLTPPNRRMAETENRLAEEGGAVMQSIVVQPLLLVLTSIRSVDAARFISMMLLMLADESSNDAIDEGTFLVSFSGFSSTSV